jgi:hypothetical protein
MNEFEVIYADLDDSSEPMLTLCLREDAQRRLQGFSPVAQDVLAIVTEAAHWHMNRQYIRYCKPIVDAIGNLESRDATLADCVIEVLKCARTINQITVETTDNMSFAIHATTTFNETFHTLITDHHILALFLHPLARNLALSQRAYSRTFPDMCRIALELAIRWGWTQEAAGKLLDHLQLYRANRAPFEGGSPNAQTWWENRPLTVEQCPLKSIALILCKIVPHAAEIERLFSDLGKTQGTTRLLDTSTLRSLGRLRGHYNETLRERGLLKRRQHAHMHTREGGGIDVDAIQQLNTVTTDVSADGNTPVAAEGFASAQLDRAFDALAVDRAENQDGGWKEGRTDAEIEYTDRLRDRSAKPGEIFDFTELDKVIAGIAPCNNVENVHVHRSARASDWSVTAMLTTKGL